jgi:hypothetical protein
MKTILATFTLTLSLASLATAVTIYDGFDYTYANPGDDFRDGSGGSGWGSNWNDSFAGLDTRDGGLSYGALITTGNAAIDRGDLSVSDRDFATAYVDGDTFWFSFLVAYDGTTQGSFEYRLRDSRATGTDLIKIDLDGPINLNNSGLSDDSGFSIPTDSTAVLLVGQITLSANTGEDTFQYWINPGSLGGASPTLGSYASSVLTMNNMSTIGSVEVVTNALSQGVIDELRFGDSFAAVTPVIPEPSTFALMAAALGMSLFMRRRGA